jgi:lipoate-protein ligase A
MTWYVLVDPAGRPGPENMALDEQLLEDAAHTGRASLRLYRWDPPCLSFGFHVAAHRRYDRAAIVRLGLAVVRRPTGGRAVWHEHELTYAVALPCAGLGGVAASCRAIHARLATGLRALGAPVELAPPGARAPRPGGGSCFATAAGGEILCGGAKLVGSAQLRRDGALLQHGSLLLAGSQDVVRTVTRGAATPAGETTLRRVLGRTVSFAEAAAALVDAWCLPGERLVRLPAGANPHAAVTISADPTETWRR